MPWQRSIGTTRTGTAAWKKLRLTVLERDSRRCYLCGAPANDVDHITAKANGGTDDPSNLAAICSGVGSCHAKKAAREGAAARHKHSAARPKERHPGLR